MRWLMAFSSAVACAHLGLAQVAVTAATTPTMIRPIPELHPASMDFFQLPAETQAYYQGFFTTREAAKDPYPRATLERLCLRADLLAYELRVLQNEIMLLRAGSPETVPDRERSLPKTNGL